MRVRLVLICLVLFLAGCGYALQVENRFPDGIEAVFVEPVHNRTVQPFLETLLFRHYARELAAQPGIALVDDRATADAVIESVIRKYKRRNSAYRGDDEVAEYSVSIEVVAGLRRQKDGVLIWQRELSWSSEFLADPSLEVQENRETATVEEVCHQLAKKLVSELLAAF
ncbi:MAG: hypothetical protein C0616_02550 [Desulfuromonas sp.]|nr:MAG: hypothetical protein C0616_02550 [Desulfuromonas sp.]